MLRLAAVPGRAHELVQALSPLVRGAGQIHGCHGAHLSADVLAPDVFWYCEEWAEASAVELRVRTHAFSQLLAVMETSAAPPVLEFRVIQDRRGLDYVADVRAPHTPSPRTTA